MLILASSTLDANAVPAVILVGLLILYAAVGSWLVARTIQGSALPNLAYATIVGITGGILAGLLAAFSIDSLFFVVTGNPLDGASLLDLFLLVAATYGLGVGAGIYVRRVRLADQASPYFAWFSLQLWTVLFVAILNILIIVGSQADVALILTCLLGGLITSWLVGHSVVVAPREALTAIHTQPNAWIPSALLAFGGGFIGWSSVGNYYQLHACNGVARACQAHLPPDAFSRQILGIVIGALIFFLIAQLGYRLQSLLHSLALHAEESPTVARRWTQVASGLALLLGLGIATFPLWGPLIGIPIQ